MLTARQDSAERRVPPPLQHEPIHTSKIIDPEAPLAPILCQFEFDDAGPRECTAVLENTYTSHILKGFPFKETEVGKNLIVCDKKLTVYETW